MKLSISARDEERCDGVVERPVDDSVHRRLETSEYSTSLVHLYTTADGVTGDATVPSCASKDVVVMSVRVGGCRKLQMTA